MTTAFGFARRKSGPSPRNRGDPGARRHALIHLRFSCHETRFVSQSPYSMYNFISLAQFIKSHAIFALIFLVIQLTSTLLTGCYVSISCIVPSGSILVPRGTIQGYCPCHPVTNSTCRACLASIRYQMDERALKIRGILSLKSNFEWLNVHSLQLRTQKRRLRL